METVNITEEANAREEIRIFLFFYRDNILRYITLIDFGLSRILGENELIENEPLVLWDMQHRKF